MPRPTYEPDCSCHLDPYRNDPIQGMSPDEAIMLREDELYFAPQYEGPRYMFSSDVTWTLTPIGYR